MQGKAIRTPQKLNSKMFKTILGAIALIITLWGAFGFLFDKHNVIQKDIEKHG